jgi:hypothetical protein
MAESETKNENVCAIAKKVFECCETKMRKYENTKI